MWPHHLRDLLAWVDWAVQLRWTLGVLVIVPFAFSAIVVSSLNASRSREQDLTLVPYDPPIGDDLLWSHAELDKALWAKRKRAIEISWDYERSRVLQSQRRLRLHALIFGDVASFTFLCSALVLSSYDDTSSASSRTRSQPQRQRCSSSASLGSCSGSPAAMSRAGRSRGPHAR